MEFGLGFGHLVLRIPITGNAFGCAAPESGGSAVAPAMTAKKSRRRMPSLPRPDGAMFWSMPQNAARRDASFAQGSAPQDEVSQAAMRLSFCHVKPSSIFN